MCGVIYFKSKENKPVNQAVEDQFKVQRARGTEGFGFYLPQTDKLVHNTQEGRIMSLLKRQPAPEVLFHHRTPTSTPNHRRSCHPFSTKKVFKKTYIMVHNGWIFNDDALRAKHEKLGIKYISPMKVGAVEKFNDTEALLWELGRYLDGQTKELDVDGAYAFILVEMNGKKPMRTHFGTNGSQPLKFVLNKRALSIASELETGDSCEPGVLYTYSHARDTIYKTKIAVKKPKAAPKVLARFRNGRGTVITSKPEAFKTDAEIIQAMPDYEELMPLRPIYDNELARLSIEHNHELDAMARQAGEDIDNLNVYIKRFSSNPLYTSHVRLARTRVAELGHLRNQAKRGKLPPEEALQDALFNKNDKGSLRWHHLTTH